METLHTLTSQLSTANYRKWIIGKSVYVVFPYHSTYMYISISNVSTGGCSPNRVINVGGQYIV